MQALQSTTLTRTTLLLSTLSPTSFLQKSKVARVPFKRVHSCGKRRRARSGFRLMFSCSFVFAFSFISSLQHYLGSTSKEAPHFEFRPDSDAIIHQFSYQGRVIYLTRSKSNPLMGARSQQPFTPESNVPPSVFDFCHIPSLVSFVFSFALRSYIDNVGLQRYSEKLVERSSVQQSGRRTGQLAFHLCAVEL